MINKRKEDILIRLDINNSFVKWIFKWENAYNNYI